MQPPRVYTDAELCHERLGDRFATALSDYDTTRRVEILVDEFLTDDMIKGKQILDVGCGLGFFSKRLTQRGAIVTAVDIGENLVRRTAQFAGCKGQVADALNLQESFPVGHFDGVVSSECIEHTPDPNKAIQSMCSVAKPDGFVAVSTPNWLWAPAVKLATLFRLRPFDGYENFSSFASMSRAFHDAGWIISRKKGLHLFPFQFGLHGLSRVFDNHCQWASSVMINLCVIAKKKGDHR